MLVNVSTFLLLVCYKCKTINQFFFNGAVRCSMVKFYNLKKYVVEKHNSKIQNWNGIAKSPVSKIQRKPNTIREKCSM